VECCRPGGQRGESSVTDSIGNLVVVEISGGLNFARQGVDFKYLSISGLPVIQKQS